MDDETQDGPYTMWQMFNDLTLVLFNNLENAADGLDRLLTSILKLSEDYSEVLVPKTSSSKCPYSHYNSFNTWLLGRLFYVCSVKELNSIHLRSIEAQSKILHILCINRASFNETILAEYYSVLQKLVEYYKEYPKDKQKKVVLENFTPALTTIQGMKLEPIYVNVNSIESVKAIIEMILDLLSECIPPNLIYASHNNTYLEEKLFSHILYTFENFDIDLKYTSFKFFVNLIKNTNRVSIIRLHIGFPTTYKAFLSYTEAIVETINVLYEKYEVNDVYLNKFNLTLLELLQESDVSSVKRYMGTFASICTIVSNESTKIFTKDVKLKCLLLTELIELPKTITDLHKKEAIEIDMLKNFYVQQIVPYVHNKNELNVLKENSYYNNTVSVILDIKACEDQNLDVYLLTFHLNRCLASLNVLLAVHFKCISKNDNHNLLNKVNLMKIWTSLVKLTRNYKHIIFSNESVFKSILNILTCSICLNKNAAADEPEMFIQIACLHTGKNSLLELQDAVRVCLLKYLLVRNMLMTKYRKKDSGNDIITYLISSLMKSRADCAKIVELTPLLLSNKIMSASKIIGDILMPVFMSRIEEVQKNVISVLPGVCCMSLGDFVIVTTNTRTGHVIFENGSLFLCVLCTRCHNKSSKTSEYIVDIKLKYDVVYMETNTSHTNSTQSALKSLFGKFLNDKQHIKIGEEYWNLVECLLNHFYIFDYGVSSTIVSEQHLKHIVQVFKTFLTDNKAEEDKSQDWNDKKEAMINMCINLLVNSTQKSLLNNDVTQQALILNYVKDFGLCQNSNLILPITKLLVYFIMYPQCPLNPKAIVYLRDVCEFHGQTPNQVYHKYKKDYCKLFVECSLYNGKDFAIYLLKVVRAFGFVGYRDFISKDGHHFLPYLIPYAVSVKEVPSMIEEIAALVQCSVSDFLIERFPHIYVYVYLTQSNDMVYKCNTILEKLTRCTVLNLIKRHFRVILTEFLLQYCSNPEKVLNACRYLACHDPDVSTPNGSMTMSVGQIADFLNPKFLGVLAYFDHKLVNTKVALSVKRKALKSFPEILQLMGVRYLTPLRYKVLATLRTALPLAKEFPKILAEAWGAFIHNIDSISLGPLLSNLAVSLLQQIEYAPHEINKIFQYLVLSNENILSSHISDLFFIEDTNISERVKIVVKKHTKRTQPESFLDKVKWYLQHLNQDIPKIKAVAYNHLNRLLESNRGDIHKAIFGGKSIDPVIVELIDKLLDGCKDADVSVSVASGLCLGQFGAIEAGHFPRRYVQPDGSPFAFSINDNCFAATALIELSRAFQYEKDTSNMDCYALTIQEILKIYDISPTGSKKEVWQSFPENMHQIMIPLLSSRYTLAYPFQPKKAHPLFGSVYATTFLEWAHNWAGQLIPLIESQSIRELLRTVHPSMRRDVRTLFLFLPYVLLHAIMSKSNLEYILQEMLAVIGSETVADDAMTAERKLKILRHIRMTPNVHSVQAEDMNQSKCSKTVYTLLDFLNRWLLEWTNVKQRPLENENYKSIKIFVDKFDKLKIARGNFECGELERALQYLELYMTEDKSRVQEQLSFLAEIYALLDEPDSVAGILSIKQSEPSVKELILAQVVTGRLQDAALCYERLAREDQLDNHSLRGMVDCYLGLDQPFTAYRLLDELETDMRELSAEPLWRLGRFEQLDELVKKPVPPSRENWGMLMGRVLIAYRKQEVESFHDACSHAAARLIAQMHTDTRGESALRTTYHSVVGLHIVAEAGHAMELLKRFKELEDGSRRCEDLLNELLSEWRQRLSIVQSDVRTVEPLLRMRRILLQQMQEQLEPSHPRTSSNLKSCIGNLWLQSAKHARKAGNLQQSYMYILNAEEYKPDQLFIEKAKMYWARGQNEPAFTSLKRRLQDAFSNQDKLTRDQRKICAKARLLIAKYNDETANVDVDVNIGYYKESVDVFKEWEKSLVCLGSYYEKVSGGADAAWTRRLHALNCYGKALQYGHRYLYRSMPRMLSIWLDVEVTSSDTSVHSVLAQMTEIIKIYSERLPLYLFLTAFSQIISRICHPVKEVYLQLKAILVSLLAAYPQHALWMSLSVLQSSYPARAKRAADVICAPRLREPHLMRLRDHFTRLATALIELCNKPILTNGETTTVSSLVRTLPKMLTGDFSHIMMPFQEFCKIVLPCKAASRERLDINIPVEPPVYIAGIEEKITILPSLQKPRKVTLRGSDGKAYIIMLKPRDDLRKDFRLMEFNTVVNRFLQDEPETRRRRLYIRTYSVLPLNEECGLIEWVPNLVGLRPVLLHIYKQKGIQTSNRELKEMMCSNKDPVEKKRRIFETQLLPRHPPVFQEWFRRVFSDPCAWYQARSAYIRTTAVMSMVGYILGLGDRHGENISFDATNGDTVHVDFNCLFNKGEAFEWPERVPFRLTHNMCAAMGPLQYEGMYRKCCEAVMRALRAQTETLMSVVGPFVYDPLVSWGRGRPPPSAPPERTNDQALQHLAHIRQRLNGMVKLNNKQLSLSLSPEGQVEHLIVEATSILNLCQMYIGWGPFL